MVFKLARKVIMNVSKVRKWDTKRQNDIYMYMRLSKEKGRESEGERERPRKTPE